MIVRIASLVCDTDDAGLGRWLGSAAGWAVIDDAADLPLRQVRWERADAPRTASSGLPRWSMGPVRGNLSAGHPAFSIPGGSVDLDTPALARVSGKPVPAAPDWRALLTATVFELLAASGYLAVHAALLSLPAGGVLVTGRSGVGKSTLVHQAALGGARYCGDDVALLWPAAGGWRGRGVTSRIRLTTRDGGQAAFRPTGAREDDGKVELAPPPGVHAPLVDLKALMRLGTEHGVTTRVARIDADACRLTLVEQCALALAPETAAAQIARFEDLIRVPCYEAATGRDILDDPARAATMLAAIAAGEVSA